MDSPYGGSVLLGNAEIVSPKAGHRTLKYLIGAPISHRAALSTNLNIKPRGAAHIKRHHVVVGMATQCACEFDISCDPAIVATPDFIDVINL